MRAKRTTVGTVAALSFLIPLSGLGDIQKVAGMQQEQAIELDYESSLAGEAADSDACEGGALSGSMTCVTEMMDGTTGGTEETSRAALAAVPVTPKVASGGMGEGSERKVVVTLSTRTGDIDAIGSFSPADQAKLRRDLFLAKRRLDDWSLELSGDQAKQLLDDGLPINVIINDGWEGLALLKPTQTQITIMPAGSGMTPEQVTEEQSENRTVDVSMNALLTYDNEYVRLITNNFSDTLATGLAFEFEHNGPTCPYSGGCDEASGYPEKAEFCSNESSSHPQACMACLRDAQAAKDSKKARYVCANAELESGGRAELRLELKFNAVDDDKDDAVIDAEPFSECKDWPSLAVIVSSKEKDSNPGNNKDSVLTPGFGPNITGLKFKIQPQDDPYGRRPNPKAEETTEAEHVDTVYLEAQLDGVHCGFDEQNKSRPAGYALVKAGSEKHDVQAPLFADRKGATVLRSDLIKIGDILERLGDSQSVEVPGKHGTRVYAFPFDISAEAERKTAKLTVYGTQDGFPRAINLSIDPQPDDAIYYSSPETTPLAPGEQFDIRIVFEGLQDLSNPLIEFQHWRGTTLIGKNTLRLERRHETANTAVEGTFVSKKLEVGPNLTETEFYPGDTLAAVFNEADNGKKERAKSISDRVELRPPSIKVKSVALKSVSDEQGQVSTDGTFEALVTFSSKPANDPGLVELRLMRAGNVIGERVATMSWQDRSAGVANAIVNIAKDKPFPSVSVGDRIEARYGSGEWAEFPEAALAVVGSPGKLESLKILIGGKEATDLPISSTAIVEAIYESAPKDRYSTSRINVVTGLDYKSRSPKTQNRLVDVTVDGSDPRRYVSDSITLLGSSEEAKTFYETENLNVLPGYKLDASLANKVATGKVVAGEQSKDRTRVTVSAFAVDGSREEVTASFRESSTAYDTLTNHATDIPAGSYEFRVNLDVLYYGKVTYQAGQEVVIEVPKQDRGRLVVELVGADGKPRTPATITVRPNGALPKGWSPGGIVHNKSSLDIPHGTFVVVVESNGWSRRFPGIKIEPGKTTKLPAGGGRGTLEISVFNVDNKKLERGFSVGGVFGETSSGGVDVDAGTHSIEVRGTFPAVVKDVVITAGEKTEKSLRLGRLAIAGIDPSSGKPGLVDVTVTRLGPGQRELESWSGKSTSLDVPEGTYAVNFVDLDERQVVSVSEGRSTPVVQKSQAGHVRIELSKLADLQTTGNERTRWECLIYRGGIRLKASNGCGTESRPRIELLPVGGYYLDVLNPVTRASRTIDFTINPNQTTTLTIGD